MALAAVVALGSVTARAEVELPRRSPRAKVSEQVGLTEIAVEYYSPAVRGRRLWGAAVPYGKVWRAEENPGWRISFGKPVALGDETVPAGVYSLLAVPSATAWTLIVNRDPSLIDAGHDYKPELDAVRLDVTPKAAPHRERLTFLFSEVGDEQASLDLEWDNVRLSIPIRVHTRAQIVESIKALDDTWRSYANVARYLAETKQDYAASLVYIDKSLALAQNAYNMGIKASLLASMARSKSGLRDARRAGEPGRHSTRRDGSERALARESPPEGAGSATLHLERKEAVLIDGDLPISPPSRRAGFEAPSRPGASAQDSRGSPGPPAQ